VTEWTKRLQAARAYAGVSTVDVADALGISDSTYKRIEADAEYYKPAKRQALLVNVAHVTKVPVSFLENGWPASDEPDLAERVEALEYQMQALRPDEARRLVAKMVGGLAEQVAQLQRELEALRAADRRRPHAPDSDQ
jgi:transcriptional regulator with XRE-family HTH domain